MITTAKKPSFLIQLSVFYLLPNVIAAVIVVEASIEKFIRSGRTNITDIDTFLAFMFAVTGLTIFILGGIVYLVAYRTQCFTYDFSKPFFPSFKNRIWLLKINIHLAVMLTVAFTILAPLLTFTDALFQPTIILSIIGSLLVFPLFLIWVDILHPISISTLTRRLKKMRLTQQEMASGVTTEVDYLNKKMKVKYDVGKLWLEPDRIRFRGDSTDFEITHGQYIRMDREAKNGSLIAFLGAEHPVIVYRNANDKTEQRIRFHVGDCWTLFSAVREINQLADRIKEWENRYWDD